MILQHPGSGDLELVERFIALGLSILDESQNGWDVLMWACLGGHAAVVSKLLSLGSNIGAKDAEQRLGLHWAAEKGHADAVGVLVKNMLQANLDIQAQVGLTLHALAVCLRHQCVPNSCSHDTSQGVAVIVLTMLRASQHCS